MFLKVLLWDSIYMYIFLTHLSGITNDGISVLCLFFIHVIEQIYNETNQRKTVLCTKNIEDTLKYVSCFFQSYRKDVGKKVICNRKAVYIQRTYFSSKFLIFFYAENFQEIFFVCCNLKYFLDFLLKVALLLRVLKKRDTCSIVF